MLTIPKNQSYPVVCGACGAFGSLGSLEADINPYYNQHLDLDLSEQQLLACVPGASCLEVPVDRVLSYLKDYGVVTEDCSPYLGVDHEGDCENPAIVCTEPDTKVKITSYTESQGSLTSTWEDIFEQMVLNGPIGLTINNGNHFVTLIGWHYDEASEGLYIIYKDSQGTAFGDHGFGIQPATNNYWYAAVQHEPYFSMIPEPPTVAVYDADGDGFYWWGIGPPPNGYENSHRDCDDSNPAKGPYLADYSCDCDDTYGNDTLRITSNTVWSDIVKIEDPVSIEYGAQLTITNTVYVPPLGQIVVKQGGHLIIDGGKITKSCDQLWKGIQVWGHIGQSQYPTSNQGYLNIINGGIIEYAKTAVYVGRIVSGTPTYSFSGGIVYGEDASFLNNEIDVEFLAYINTNPAQQPMDNAGGFSNCIFKMYDQEFVLSKPSNVAGIYISGYYLPAIISSFFSSHIGNQDIQNLEEPFFGCVYLDGSTGYHIENNHFDGPWFHELVPPVPISRIGLYIKNSGSSDNEVYSNLFTGLDAGIVAEGTTKGASTGLCLKCNDFRACINDIMVIPDPLRRGERYIGIKESQGANSTTTSALTGNTFSPEIQDEQPIENSGNYKCFWSYYNVADHIYYYHHAQDPYYITYPSEENYTDESITLTNKYVVYIKTTACPSGLDEHPHYKSSEDPWLEIAEADAQLLILRNTHDSLLDGGNTEDLDFEIISSFPDEALELRQQLMTDSPYLSDTIMKQAIYKENVLPNAMIRDVLSANPQSAKSGEILEAVDSRYDAMPDYMMAEIMQGRDQIGALESLESNIGYWEQYRSRAVNRLIRKYLSDSTVTAGVDSLINLFQNESDLQSKYRLAFTYWDRNQEEQAMNALADIPAEFELSSLEQEIHQQYLDLFDILQMMKNNNLNTRQLDSSSVQELMNIMDTDLPLISAYSRGMLVQGRYIDFTETVSFPSELKSYPDYYNLHPKGTNFLKEEQLLLFPNPAGDYVIAYFNSINYAQKGALIIDDIQSRRIVEMPLDSQQSQVVINLSTYPNGIYFISLIINGKLIECEKLSKSGN